MVEPTHGGDVDDKILSSPAEPRIWSRTSDCLAGAPMYYVSNRLLEQRQKDWRREGRNSRRVTPTVKRREYASTSALDDDDEGRPTREPAWRA